MSLGYRKGLIGGQVNGPALTAAAAASCLPTHMKIPIPGGFFDTVGQMLFMKLQGKISCVVTTPGFARFDIRLGGTVVFDGLAVPLNVVAKTDVAFEVEAWLTLRAVGPTANFFGWGKFSSEAVVGSPLPSAGGSGAIHLPYNTTPVVGNNFDATVSNVLDAFYTQTVATGSLTVEQALFESHRWE